LGLVLIGVITVTQRQEMKDCALSVSSGVWSSIAGTVVHQGHQGLAFRRASDYASRKEKSSAT
jgi:hypothetical protein